MSLQKQQAIATLNDWHRIGLGEIEVEVALTPEEKIQYGRSQSESICEVKRLAEELSTIKGEFKNKIEAHEIVINSTSIFLKSGKRPMKKKFPIFLDTKKREKHFVDLDTGDVVDTRPATPDDMQLKFLQE